MARYHAMVRIVCCGWGNMLWLDNNNMEEGEILVVKPRTMAVLWVHFAFRLNDKEEASNVLTNPNPKKCHSQALMQHI